MKQNRRISHFRFRIPMIGLVLALAALMDGCSVDRQITVTGIGTRSSESLQDVPEDSALDADSSSESSRDIDTPEQIAVYVCGAVRRSGVYYLDGGSRVCDALEACGGFSEDADSQWLNQAKPLSDGEMLIVYTLEETAQMKEQGAGRGDTVSTGSSGTGAASGADAMSDAGSALLGGDALINLNTATREQLMTLPGIGEAKADAIIRYRTETGYFASTEDVMNISGIKNSVYEKIRDRITV